MPIQLKKGEVVRGDKGVYRVVSDEPFIGGQAFSYCVKGERGRKLFIKQFTDVSPRFGGDAFVKRQKALMERLKRIPDYVSEDIDLFVYKDTFFKVSEWMEGRSLGGELRAAESHSSAFTPELRMTNASVLAYTIAKIHEQGIAHLDLKPDNAFLERRFIKARGGETLVIRLIDFDGAVIEGSPLPDGFYGTIGYLSPEHVLYDRVGPPGTDSDVFTLGIMLYEILANRYPFPDLEKAFLERKTQRPKEAAPWLSDKIAELIWRALSPNRKERPTASEIHQGLIAKEAIRVALVGASRRIRFHKDMVLGRKQLRGVPGYEYVDDVQARIFKGEGDTWVIAHLRDTVNPTRINGETLRVGERRPLREGDVIQIGLLELRVEMEYE